MNAIAFFENKIKGSVRFYQSSPFNQTTVIFDLYGFQPNKTYACHIHEYGDLTEGCKTLGAHLNLTNKEHGTIFYDIENSHTGDLLNNINSDKNGKVQLYYDDPRLNLFGDVSTSIIGCSVVIHEGQDDYGFGGNEESKITGNAGGRMTCAIIGKSK
jgi:superoxide dismutase, Cu-Zn family